MKEMKKIAWVTIDSFVDCDYVPIDYVSKEYDVDWFIVMPTENSRYKETEFETFSKEHPMVNIHFVYEKHRMRDPRRVGFYYVLGRKLLGTKADIYYINVVATSPWLSVLWWQLPKDKRIITAHQGAVHVGMKYKFLSNFSRDLIYRQAQVVNMFSNAQATLFKERYSKSIIKVIPLSLKDYGKPSVISASSKDNEVIFLFFGLINYGKNVDLLIDAACNLYEKSLRNFKVKICGVCKSWDFYQKRIRYPALFDLNIGFVKNEDIPNLLAESHYCVQPYRAVSQSGVVKVAFQYNTPVIVTNLPGFMDDVVEGLNGFSFMVENVTDLERVMRERVENFHNEYDVLVSKMEHYTKETYSPEIIGNKYIEMFNSLLSINIKDKKI